MTPGSDVLDGYNNMDLVSWHFVTLSRGMIDLPVPVCQCGVLFWLPS